MSTKNVRALCVASALCCWGLAVPDARGQILPPDCYVNDSATGGANTGSSWADAFVDLQGALSQGSCVTVWVAAGTYTPSVVRPGPGLEPGGLTFDMRSGLQLYGGFAGNEDGATFDINLRQISTNETILDGDAGVLGTAWHVVTGYDVPFRLDGFTVRDGNADGGNEDDVGGGMFIYGFHAPTIANCTIKNNRSREDGGGVYVNGNSHAQFEGCVFDANVTEFGESPNKGGALMSEGESSPDFVSCEFINNRAEDGGALAFEFLTAPGDIIIDGCSFRDNTAVNDGGAIHSGGSQVLCPPCTAGPFPNPFFLIRRTDFYRNLAADRGGAFFINARNARFENCKFGGNEVTATGAAIHAATSDEGQPGLVMINCLFTGNKDTGAGAASGAVYLDEWEESVGNFRQSTPEFYNCTFSQNTGEVELQRGNPKFVNCVFWNDDTPIASDEIDVDTAGAGGWFATFQNCVIEGGMPAGVTNNGTNLFVDPTFELPQGLDGTVGNEDDDLRLAIFSPAINAGSFDLVPEDDYDFDGDGITDECFPRDLNECARIAGIFLTVMATPDVGAFESGADFLPFGVNGICDQDDRDNFDCDLNNILDSCETVPDCDNNGLLDACEILGDPGLDLDLAYGLDACQPKIVHGATGVSFVDHAFSGYIDPRAESTDGMNLDMGIKVVTIVFSEPVFRQNGNALDFNDFEVTVTGGTAPFLSVVDATNNPKFVLTFGDFMPLQEWVTITATVWNAEEPPRGIWSLPYGYVNCDVNGNCGPGVSAMLLT